MRALPYLPFLLISTLATSNDVSKRRTCTIDASGSNATDDAPAIRTAFKECGRNGRVIFGPHTYYINSVLNITGLSDVDVDITGELLVYTPITSISFLG